MLTPLEAFLVSAAVPVGEGLVLKLFHLPKPTRWQQAGITALNVVAICAWAIYKWGWESLRPAASSDLPMGLLTLLAMGVVTWAMFRMPYTPREYQTDRTRRP